MCGTPYGSGAAGASGGWGAVAGVLGAAGSTLGNGGCGAVAGATGVIGGSTRGPVPDGGSGIGGPSGGGGGAGAVITSLAIASAPPYSIAAVNGTTSQRWSTPQRMRQPIGNGNRHYM